MPLNLTEEQIIQLAPDAASVKAGKGLAVPGKWVLLACSERAVWGHCQGSGKNPYQTAIDRTISLSNVPVPAGNSLVNMDWGCCFCSLPKLTCSKRQKSLSG